MKSLAVPKCIITVPLYATIFRSQRIQLQLQDKVFPN